MMSECVQTLPQEEQFQSTDPSTDENKMTSIEESATESSPEFNPRNVFHLNGKNLEIPPCPPNDNEVDWRNSFENSSVYLVGITKTKQSSKDDVVKAIQHAQPDVLMLALCPKREIILFEDLEPNTNDLDQLFPKSESNFQNGLFRLLGKLVPNDMVDLDLYYTDEFRAAYDEASKIEDCKLLLGDTPIDITYHRVLDILMSFSWYQCMKILFSGFCTVEKQDKEVRDVLDSFEDMIPMLEKEFPEVTKAFIHDRDDYMIRNLQQTLITSTCEKRLKWLENPENDWQPIKVVAAVGMIHTQGILNKWQKTDEED